MGPGELLDRQQPATSRPEPETNQTGSTVHRGGICRRPAECGTAALSLSCALYPGAAIIMSPPLVQGALWSRAPSPVHTFVLSCPHLCPPPCPHLQVQGALAISPSPIPSHRIIGPVHTFVLPCPHLCLPLSTPLSPLSTHSPHPVRTSRFRSASSRRTAPSATSSRTPLSACLAARWQQR